MVDEALNNLSARFDSMYAKIGRPSIPPEKLLRAQLIQMLYSIRSERLLMEDIDYSMLFRWFVGMNLDEAVWDATVFTKNRNRLLEGDVAREFLCEVVKQAQAKGLTSDEHFTVAPKRSMSFALSSLRFKEGTLRECSSKTKVLQHAARTIARTGTSAPCGCQPESRRRRHVSAFKARPIHSACLRDLPRNGQALSAKFAVQIGRSERFQQHGHRTVLGTRFAFAAGKNHRNSRRKRGQAGNKLRPAQSWQGDLH